MKKRNRGSGRQERGQTLILMLMAMTVTFVIGAIAVDIGLWLSERRGAQTDADFIALTAAWELLDPGATEADAKAAADDALDANDEQLNASIFGEPEVDLVERCVSVDVRHDSRPLFFQIFGLGNPDIGAHAKACAGEISSPTEGASPFQISDDTAPCFNSDETPNYTVLCPLEFGAGGGVSGSRGLVDVDAPDDYCSDTHGGVQSTTDAIANGADGTCAINAVDSCDPGNVGPWYDCVSIQPGNAKAVTDGVALRLAREGDCDDNGDGIDSFDESVTIIVDTGNPLTSLYEAKDCDPFTDGKQISPRLITIFVLEETPGGNASIGHPIEGFAGYHLSGCSSEAYDDITDPNDPRLDKKCETLGGPGGGGGAGPPGRTVVYGQFVNLILSGAGIVPADDATTLFGIGLTE